MTVAPTVSVVMIFFNAERFMQEAIASVSAQTYDDWELILVDDGSVDGSTTIARAEAARLSHRVRYVEHEGHQNKGMSPSRALGVAHARGTLMAFLDADDMWLPGKLHEQIAILEEHPRASAVYGTPLCAAGNVNYSDQASLNVLLSLLPYRQLALFDGGDLGWACEAVTMVAAARGPDLSYKFSEREPLFDGDVVYTSAGKPFCIVHQYDRIPHWRCAWRRGSAEQAAGAIPAL